MAVSLIVEDGTLTPSANSYVSLSEFTDFYENTEGGLTLSDDETARFLIKAAMYLQKYDFKGRLISASQSLNWPRFDVYVNEEFIAYDKIPDKIKTCQCLIAASMIKGFDPSKQIDSSSVVKRKKIDVIETEYFENEYSYRNISIPLLDSAIKPYLKTSGFGLFAVRL